MTFNKLDVSGASYFINSRMSFEPIGTFRPETVRKVFDFAYEMSFGKGGEHRDHRSGGTHRRRNGEIFANTFQGKLAECAIYNLLYKQCDISPPDFATYGLGEWDKADFYIDNHKVSIKSTKSFGNLLLLETKDWNEDGVYLPNDEAYDFTFLVRMNPYCEDILRRNRLLLSDTVDIEQLYSIVCNNIWEYDIPGFVTLEDLKYVIRNGFILPQSSMLNGRTKMDAENYYIQSGDMRSINEFLGGI